MHTPAHRLAATVFVLALVASACAPSSAPTESPTPSVEPAAIPLLSTPAPETAIPTVVPTDLPGIPIPPDTNMLILLQGKARITHDNGGSWTATGTGQYLVAGDEIQTSEEAIALVFLLNGGAVRLEGPSDFQIVRAERDTGSGATKIILKLWDGYGLFDTNPLPTPDSLFQFHVLTTFVGLEYDPELAGAVDPGAARDPERSVIAGGVLNEDTERLYHFRGPASLFLLDQIQGVTFAAELPAAADEVADLEAAFLDDYALEAELEAFGVTAGYLIAECKQRGSCQDVDLSGNTVSQVEQLETGQRLYFFGHARTVEPEDPTAGMVRRAILDNLKALAAQQAQSAGSASAILHVTIGRMTWKRTPAPPAASRSPSVAAPAAEILQGEPTTFGCDPRSGAGCLPGAGCDPSTGSGCLLPSGCNLATGSGCQSVPSALQAYPVPDAAGGVMSYRLEVPGSVPAGCDPNAAGDCDRLYDPTAWIYFDELDDEVAACWCPANPPPPGYGPPPPGTFMYYRCFCSDRGAMRDRPKP